MEVLAPSGTMRPADEFAGKKDESVDTAVPDFSAGAKDAELKFKFALLTTK